MCRVTVRYDVRLYAVGILVGFAILCCTLLFVLGTEHTVTGVLAALVMLGCMIGAASLAGRLR